MKNFSCAYGGCVCQDCLGHVPKVHSRRQLAAGCRPLPPLNLPSGQVPDEAEHKNFPRAYNGYVCQDCLGHVPKVHSRRQLAAGCRPLSPLNLSSGQVPDEAEHKNFPRAYNGYAGQDCPINLSVRWVCIPKENHNNDESY